MRDGVYLVTAKNCPNCVTAKNFLKDKDYTLLDAQENAELMESLGIMQAPTLIVVKDKTTSLYTNASNIRAYAERM